MLHGSHAKCTSILVADGLTSHVRSYGYLLHNNTCVMLLLLLLLYSTPRTGVCTEI